MQDNALIHLYEIAKGNLAMDPSDPEAAVRDALSEAHSALSQAQFFALLDANGGRTQLMTTISQALRG